VNRDLIAYWFVVPDDVYLGATFGEPAEVVEVDGADRDLRRERM
jgi:hypothetical protein